MDILALGCPSMDRRNLLVDVTVPHPCSVHTLGNSAADPLTAVTAAHRRKVTRYPASTLHGAHFLPFAVDTFGTTTPEVVSFLETTVDTWTREQMTVGGDNTKQVRETLRYIRSLLSVALLLGRHAVIIDAEDKYKERRLAGRIFAVPLKAAWAAKGITDAVRRIRHGGPRSRGAAR